MASALWSPHAGSIARGDANDNCVAARTWESRPRRILFGFSFLIIENHATTFLAMIDAIDNSPAPAAADTAFQIFPGSAPVRWVRGNALYASDRRVEAEQEWLAAIALGLPDKDSAIVWSRLGELYDQQERVPDALHAWQQTAQLTSDPATKTRALVKLARLYLVTRQPKQALQALDEAEHSAPAEMTAVTDGRSFKFDVAQGRAAIWRAMGDLDQAVAFQEQAVKLDPDAADAWSHLAKLYQRQGRVADEHRAEERANALGASQNR